MFQTYNHPSPSTEATDHPGRPQAEERIEIGDAAKHARLVFPGAIGEYLAADLESWEKMSLRYDQCGLTARMIKAVMALPDPKATE